MTMMTSSPIFIFFDLNTLIINDIVKLRKDTNHDFLPLSFHVWTVMFVWTNTAEQFVDVCVSARRCRDLPSAIVQVDDERLISKLFKRLIVVTIHVSCVGKQAPGWATCGERKICVRANNRVKPALNNLRVKQENLLLLVLLLLSVLCQTCQLTH